MIDMFIIAGEASGDSRGSGLIAELLKLSPHLKIGAVAGPRMRSHKIDMGGKTPLPETSPLYKQIVKDFGSYDAWKADFIATGAMRGIGWAILYYDPLTSRLFNTWINEHDLGHLATGQPLLIMDVFEHAYLPDYKLDRAKYIDAFFLTINWPIVISRFK